MVHRDETSLLVMKLDPKRHGADFLDRKQLRVCSDLERHEARTFGGGESVLEAAPDGVPPVKEAPHAVADFEEVRAAANHQHRTDQLFGEIADGERLLDTVDAPLKEGVRPLQEEVVADGDLILAFKNVAQLVQNHRRVIPLREAQLLRIMRTPSENFELPPDIGDDLLAQYCVPNSTTQP